MTRVYGWLALLLLIAAIIGLFANGIYRLILSQFRGVYSVSTAETYSPIEFLNKSHTIVTCSAGWRGARH